MTFESEVTSAKGATLSVMTMFCICVDVFPAASAYVQVTAVVPLAVIGNVTLCVPIIAPEQLSVAVGAVKLETEH